MPRRRACDRCHQLKQKCIDNQSAQKCAGCMNTKSTCTTDRLVFRQGRRPRPTRLGDHCATHVFEIDLIGSSPALSLPARNHPAVCAAFSNHISNCIAVTLDESVLTSATQSLDSCFTSISQRFKHEKETMFEADGPGVLEKFFSHFEIFMLGPSFALELRNAVKCLYACAPTLLHDIIQELEFALPSQQQKPSNQLSATLSKQVDITTGSNSLQLLRTAEATSFDNAFAIIGLGQVLAAFDLLTICTGAESIVRSSLLSVKFWTQDLEENDVSRSIVVGTIFWDTLCCLVRQEVPVRAHMSSPMSAIDRIAGLCTTILPLFYDLCIASEVLRKQQVTGSARDTAAIEHVRDQLLQWTPSRPDEFFTLFSREEITRIEAQASMYRYAGLLICHRTLYAIGTSDELAFSLASTIIAEFDSYTSALGDGTKLNFIHFPLLLAALEVEDLHRDIWTKISLAASAPVWIDKIRELVVHVWRERNAGARKILFDIVNDGPDFVVIP